MLKPIITYKHIQSSIAGRYGNREQQSDKYSDRKCISKCTDITENRITATLTWHIHGWARHCWTLDRCLDIHTYIHKQLFVSG